MIDRNNRLEWIGLIAVLALLIGGASESAPAEVADRIQPSKANPFYWQYKGKPVLLLGGSGQDNLFNHPAGPKPGGTLEKHLDILRSVGGNYVRNTMSHRDVGNVFPYLRLKNGKFDLNQPNPEYWNRFETFLRMTAERDIIVQVEVWASFDYGNDRHGSGGPGSKDDMAGWKNHPFNPVNNVNYTQEDSGLPGTWNEDDGFNKNPFFLAVPSLGNNKVVLPYQQAFVDKILSHSLKYSHVLYTSNNENNLPAQTHDAGFGPDKIHAWADYWTGYIQKKATEAGKKVETGDMVNMWFWTWPGRDRFWGWQADRPQLYNFIDVSQVNSQTHMISGERETDWNGIMELRWQRLMEVRDVIADSRQARPMNNTKIYGAGSNSETRYSADGGIQRFWRNLMAGCASARFHRPASGLGLSETAQANIRSARLFTDAMNIFAARPRNDLLSDRSNNEAYLLAEAGRQYAVYFPKDAGDGRVTLDLTEAKGRWTLRWLNILESQWTQEQTLEGGKKVQIKKPDAGHWAVMIVPAK